MLRGVCVYNDSYWLMIVITRLFWLTVNDYTHTGVVTDRQFIVTEKSTKLINDSQVRARAAYVYYKPRRAGSYCII